MEVRRSVTGKRVGGGLVGSASGSGVKGKRGGALRAFARGALGVTAGVVVGQTVGDDDSTADIDGGSTIAVGARLYGGVVMFGSAGSTSAGGCNRGPFWIHCSTSSTEE